jgi:hypothetical protein
MGILHNFEKAELDELYREEMSGMLQNWQELVELSGNDGKGPCGIRGLIQEEYTTKEFEICHHKDGTFSTHEKIMWPHILENDWPNGHKKGQEIICRSGKDTYLKSMSLDHTRFACGHMLRTLIGNFEHTNEGINFLKEVFCKQNKEEGNGEVCLQQ